jgi:hypothetical protein
LTNPARAGTNPARTGTNPQAVIFSEPRFVGARWRLGLIGRGFAIEEGGLEVDFLMAPLRSFSPWLSAARTAYGARLRRYA